MYKLLCCQEQLCTTPYGLHSNTLTLHCARSICLCNINSSCAIHSLSIFSHCTYLYCLYTVYISLIPSYISIFLYSSHLSITCYLLPADVFLTLAAVIQQMSHYGTNKGSSYLILSYLILSYLILSYLILNQRFSRSFKIKPMRLH